MLRFNHRPAKIEAGSDAGMVGDADSSPPNRPLKLPRLDPATDTASPSGAEMHAQPGTRTRNYTACERCRSRKTRCDNRRPSCGYCVRIGVPCLYEPESSSSCHIVGPQILEAVGNLTALVQRQAAEDRYCGRCHRHVQDALSPNSVASVESAQSPPAQFIPQQNQSFRQNWTGVAHSRPRIGVEEQRPVKKQRPIQAQGVESILKWKIYSPMANIPNLFSEVKIDLAAAHHLPSLEYSELVRLESKYITGVHIYNPILDLPSLRQKILHVSENGLDWSTRTCLVTLVCAVGAIAGRYRERSQSALNPFANLRSSPDRAIESGESDVELAMRHWDVAAKRLGYVFGQDDLEAVQCLCLAGIWHMHILQPLQAWKYFTLAGNSWYTSTIKEPHYLMTGNMVNQTKSLTLEQSLYFTIYKSLCELHVELDLPGSPLEDINLSQAFPLPPTLDSELSSSGSDVAERGWYFYLAEIAARHHINRMLRGRFWIDVVPRIEGIWRMLTEAELFETQVQEWHSTLPPMLKFDTPDGPFLQSEPEELKRILRHRYLTSRELIYRPFVRLCVEYELDSLEPHLRTAVSTLATRGLQCCMYKLCQLSPQRHQGTWFMIRGFATCSMILLAASKARKNPRFLGAAAMIMPKGWRQQILQAISDVGPCWGDGLGGTGEIRRMVERVLATES